MSGTTASIRRVLAAVKDPSGPISPAVLKAARLARAARAELTLFHAIDMAICAEAYASGDRTIEDDRVGLRNDYRRTLEQMARSLESGEPKVRVASEWDFPAYEAILRYAVRAGIDLIVADHRHPHEPGFWSGHPTDWELLRESPVPVLIVKQPPPFSSAPVLAAIDPLHRHAKPADLDAHICGMAQFMSSVLGGPWQVVHAVAAARPDAADASTDGQKADLAQRPIVEQLLRSLELSPSEVHVLPGRPAETILNLARRLNTSMVVMGAVSRSGLPRLILGNTAEELIDALPCDVLVVKSEGFGLRFPMEVRGMNIYSVLSAPPG